MKSVSALRLCAHAEGISFLLLLLVAMPLKYIWQLPQAVRVVGTAHGVLFIAFIALLYIVASDKGWSARRSLLAVALSLIPAGTFFFDRVLKEPE